MKARGKSETRRASEWQSHGKVVVLIIRQVAFAGLAR
jgi:hypothetical protein